MRETLLFGFTIALEPYKVISTIQAESVRRIPTVLIDADGHMFSECALHGTLYTHRLDWEAKNLSTVSTLYPLFFSVCPPRPKKRNPLLDHMSRVHFLLLEKPIVNFLGGLVTTSCVVKSSLPTPLCPKLCGRSFPSRDFLFPTPHHLPRYFTFTWVATRVDSKVYFCAHRCVRRL